MYTLNNKVIEFLRGHNAAQAELCAVMGIQSNALRYHLDGNVPNGSLTKWNALQIIAKYYNQPVENLLVEPKYVMDVK